MPPLSGFFSKDEILAAAFARGAEMPVYYLFYALGVVAAFLTAFYMARLMAMTFLGENRTGEEERRHLHEAPWIMTGPAGRARRADRGRRRASTCRPSSGDTTGWSRWLEPVTAAAAAFATVELPHGSTEFFLVGAAVLVGVVGLALGYRLTLARRIPPAHEAPEDRGVARVLNRKYFVDEIYDAARGAARSCGSPAWSCGRAWTRASSTARRSTARARLSRGLGWLGSRLQTGQVGRVRRALPRGRAVDPARRDPVTR